ncbi:hypothetical protein [Bacillus thuringiensis]|nr:hypothetical protein [Bacillus thuringiensis]PEV43612.1 hypothetical protein CN432_22455 [Bacillus thuringiensis]
MEKEKTKFFEEMNKDITVTEKKYAQNKIGQTLLKKKLLLTNPQCKICGVTEQKFLIVSHIKQWRVANYRERLDVEIG